MIAFKGHVVSRGRHDTPVEELVESPLELSEDLYRATIDAMCDPLHVVDRELRILLCNNCFRARLQEIGQRADPVGQKLFDVLPELPREVREEYRRVIETGEPLHSRDRVTFGDRTVSAETTKIPIKDSDGTVGRVVTIIRDISDRLRLEADLRSSAKMDAVGRLAGGVAHSFNNLLTVVKAHAKFARNALEKRSDIDEDIAEILRATERAENLIGQLLAFSRRQTIEPQQVDFSKILMSFDGLVRKIIPENIELVTLPGSGIWKVKIDRGQIEQVLLHLVVNACDAMARGGKLTLALENVILDQNAKKKFSESETGEYVCLSVADTGAGMSPEVRQNLFEPFFTTKDDSEGAGLGLAMVYGTVKQHNGHITVHSHPGSGSVIRVFIPRSRESVRRRAPSTPNLALSERNETVLVVEDEPQVRRVMIRILKKLGYTILEAGNGEEAIRVAAGVGGDIDLLLTDVVMPRMGGPELACELSRQRPGMPVLFVSGYPKGTLSHNGDLDSDVAFLKKPFTPTELAEKVREVLCGRGDGEP